MDVIDIIFTWLGWIIVILSTIFTCLIFFIGIKEKDSTFVFSAFISLGLSVFGVYAMTSSPTQDASKDSPYAYEAQLKDGRIEQAIDCYKRDNGKKICDFSYEKRVVVDYWKIEE